MNFGERLKILRKSAEMTQDQLAVKLGVHFQTVSKWERGQIAPDLAMFGSIATTLSVSLEKLLCLEEKNCVGGTFDCQALGLCIATQRKRFALSQSDLAKKLQTSSDIVSKWERGIVCPRIEQIIALSQLFLCSPSELYYAKCCNNLVDRFCDEQSKEIPKTKQKNRLRFAFRIASVVVLVFVVVLVGYVIKINFFKPQNQDELTPQEPPIMGTENGNGSQDNVEKGLLYDINGYECTVRSVGGFKGEEKIIIPDTYLGFPVVEIKNDAFKDCVNLKQITLPQTVICIGNNAFENCEKLEKIEIPNSVITIGSHAFEGCSSLKKIELPYTLSGINENVFENCFSLEEIVLLGNIAHIGAGAFRGCSSLKNIYCVYSIDWTSIVIGNNNSCFENALKYYYKSVEPSLLATGIAYDGNYWHYNENGDIVVWVYDLGWYEHLPVFDGVLIKGYSATEMQYNETLKQWEIHKAVDVFSGGNGYVYAPCLGKVVNVYENTQEGGVVVCESADGKYTFTYKGIKVGSSIEIGKEITRIGMVLGQIVGGESEMGAELLTGPHVHFEMTYNGRSVDPTLFFTFKTNE